MISMWKKSLTPCLRFPRTQVLFPFKRKMSTSNDVLIESVKDKGIIILNRPKALNALNLPMIRQIYPILKQWEGEKCMVLIKGVGDKAFCAGGDVKAVTLAEQKGDKMSRDFFREEYTLNSLIGTYHIPYIAIIDGITMGGGVGLSVHGRYRIATERTLFAMPETSIGLFPDVGGSYFLPRLGGKVGLYLALSGNRLKGQDVVKSGIATHFCDSSLLEELESGLINNCKSDTCIDEVLDKFSKCSKHNKGDFILTPYLKQIDYCFSAQSIEDIFVRLDKDGSTWAIETLEKLSKASPTSLKVVIRELEEGATKSLQECLAMEYRLACHCLQGHDFIEGVRALLIDKDQNPKWKPTRIQDVTNELVESHFAHLSPEDELKL